MRKTTKIVNIGLTTAILLTGASMHTVSAQEAPVSQENIEEQGFTFKPNKDVDLTNIYGNGTQLNLSSMFTDLRKTENGIEGKFTVAGIDLEAFLVNEEGYNQPLSNVIVHEDGHFIFTVDELLQAGQSIGLGVFRKPDEDGNYTFGRLGTITLTDDLQPPKGEVNDGTARYSINRTNLAGERILNEVRRKALIGSEIVLKKDDIRNVIYDKDKKAYYLYKVTGAESKRSHEVKPGCFTEIKFTVGKGENNVEFQYITMEELEELWEMGNPESDEAIFIYTLKGENGNIIFKDIVEHGEVGQQVHVEEFPKFVNSEGHLYELISSDKGELGETVTIEEKKQQFRLEGTYKQLEYNKDTGYVIHIFELYGENNKVTTLVKKIQTGKIGDTIKVEDLRTDSVEKDGVTYKLSERHTSPLAGTNQNLHIGAAYEVIYRYYSEDNGNGGENPDPEKPVDPDNGGGEVDPDPEKPVDPDNGGGEVDPDPEKPVDPDNGGGEVDPDPEKPVDPDNGGGEVDPDPDPEKPVDPDNGGGEVDPDPEKPVDPDNGGGEVDPDPEKPVDPDNGGGEVDPDPEKPVDPDNGGGEVDPDPDPDPEKPVDPDNGGGEVDPDPEKPVDPDNGGGEVDPDPEKPVDPDNGGETPDPEKPTDPETGGETDNGGETPNPEKPVTPTKLNGWYEVSNIWYFYKEDGEKAIGWLKDGDHWYFFNEKGEMQTGWLKDDQNWYYLKANGQMARGWENINGTYYLFKSWGKMSQNEWMPYNGGWYFMKESGAMAHNEWHPCNGVWYYFKADGTMAVNEVINGYKVDETGACID